MTDRQTGKLGSSLATAGPALTSDPKPLAHRARRSGFKQTGLWAGREQRICHGCKHQEGWAAHLKGSGATLRGGNQIGGAPKPDCLAQRVTHRTGQPPPSLIPATRMVPKSHIAATPASFSATSTLCSEYPRTRWGHIQDSVHGWFLMGPPDSHSNLNIPEYSLEETPLRSSLRSGLQKEHYHDAN